MRCRLLIVRSGVTAILGPGRERLLLLDLLLSSTLIELKIGGGRRYFTGLFSEPVRSRERSLEGEVGEGLPLVDSELDPEEVADWLEREKPLDCICDSRLGTERRYSDMSCLLDVD